MPIINTLQTIMNSQSKKVNLNKNNNVNNDNNTTNTTTTVAKIITKEDAKIAFNEGAKICKRENVVENKFLQLGAISQSYENNFGNKFVNGLTTTSVRGNVTVVVDPELSNILNAKIEHDSDNDDNDDDSGCDDNDSDSNNNKQPNQFVALDWNSSNVDNSNIIRDNNGQAFVQVNASQEKIDYILQMRNMVHMNEMNLTTRMTNSFANNDLKKYEEYLKLKLQYFHNLNKIADTLDANNGKVNFIYNPLLDTEYVKREQEAEKEMKLKIEQIQEKIKSTTDKSKITEFKREIKDIRRENGRTTINYKSKKTTTTANGEISTCFTTRSTSSSANGGSRKNRRKNSNSSNDDDDEEEEENERVSSNNRNRNRNNNDDEDEESDDSDAVRTEAIVTRSSTLSGNKKRKEITTTVNQSSSSSSSSSSSRKKRQVYRPTLPLLSTTAVTTNDSSSSRVMEINDDNDNNNNNNTNFIETNNDNLNVGFNFDSSLDGDDENNNNNQQYQRQDNESFDFLSTEESGLTAEEIENIVKDFGEIIDIGNNNNFMLENMQQPSQPQQSFFSFISSDNNNNNVVIETPPTITNVKENLMFQNNKVQEEEFVSVNGNDYKKTTDIQTVIVQKKVTRYEQLLKQTYQDISETCNKTSTAIVNGSNNSSVASTPINNFMSPSILRLNNQN